MYLNTKHSKNLKAYICVYVHVCMCAHTHAPGRDIQGKGILRTSYRSFDQPLFTHRPSTQIFQLQDRICTFSLFLSLLRQE